MSGRWFRVYDELLTDPKVQRLPGELFKFLINLWCIASRSGGRLPDIQEMSRICQLQVSYTSRRISYLTSLGLLEEIEGGYRPHNWNKRQYKSDISTDRVKKHRNKKPKSGNGFTSFHETPPEYRVQSTERAPLTPHDRNVSAKRSLSNGKRTVQEAAADLHERVAAKLAEWDNFGSSSN